MATSNLLAALLFISASTSFADVTPLLSCGSIDRRMAPSERVKTFLECLREQGHDEELLAELKSSFEKQSGASSSSSSSSSLTSQCPPVELDEKGRFSYCSGMTDLQCRTLTLVLESLLNVPKSTDGRSSLVQRYLLEPLEDSSDNDQDIRTALMNVILSRFNDILDEYKRWRVEHGVRKKRSESQASGPAQSYVKEEDRKFENKSNSSLNVELPEGRATKKLESSEVADQAKPEIKPSNHPRALRMRRQVPQGLPFKLPDKLTPEMQAVLEGYLAWREKNGYGKMTARWG